MTSIAGPGLGVLEQLTSVRRQTGHAAKRFTDRLLGIFRVSDNFNALSVFMLVSLQFFSDSTSVLFARLNELQPFEFPDRVHMAIVEEEDEQPAADPLRPAIVGKEADHPAIACEPAACPAARLRVPKIL